jgi:hypothetical protein
LLLRERIAALIGGQLDMMLVGECSNGREAIQQFRTYRQRAVTEHQGQAHDHVAEHHDGIVKVCAVLDRHEQTWQTGGEYQHADHLHHGDEAEHPVASARYEAGAARRLRRARACVVEVSQRSADSCCRR